MKRIRAFTGIFALVVLTMVLTACGKSEFGLTENTEKKMTITAERADKDAFFMVGSLEVSDGEQIVITSNLEKGSIRVEIVGVAEEQNIDQLMESGMMKMESTVTADYEFLPNGWLKSLRVVQKQENMGQSTEMNMKTELVEE